MKFLTMPQGTPEWHLARCGLVTASMFETACKEVGGLNDQQAKFVDAIKYGATEKEAAADAGYKAVPRSEIIRRALAGEKTTDYSDEAKRYADDLSIERVSQKPHGEPARAWVLERGHIMEEAARMIYESRTGAFVTESGICVSDDGRFGYSSDGLVDDDGLIEIKAPIDSSKIRAMWLTGDTSEYDFQMHGGMWLTGRKYCDLIMYVPDLKNVGKDMYVKRVHRDDEFIDKMVEKLVAFEALVSDAEAFWRAPT